MDAHDVDAAGRVLLRICKHLAEHLRRGDVDVEIERREVLVVLVEEQRADHAVFESHALFLVALLAEVLGGDAEVAGIAAAELLKGQFERGERAQTEAVVGVAGKGVHAVVEHIAALAAIRHGAYPVAVEQMRGRRGEIDAEGVAPVVAQRRDHVGNAVGDDAASSSGTSSLLPYFGQETRYSRSSS